MNLRSCACVSCVLPPSRRVAPRVQSRRQSVTETVTAILMAIALDRHTLPVLGDPGGSLKQTHASPGEINCRNTPGHGKQSRGNASWGTGCTIRRRTRSLSDRERLCGTNCLGSSLHVRQRTISGAHCPRESGCGGDLSGELTVRERAVVGANGLGSSLSDRGWLWGRTISGAHCPRERAVVRANCLESLLSERESGCGDEQSRELTVRERESGCGGELSGELTVRERTVVGANGLRSSLQLRERTGRLGRDARSGSKRLWGRIAR